MNLRPQYETELFGMLVVDFITHQDDRHLSNFAIKICGEDETFYPLYDNGRSLFYEDTEELVKMKCSDPVLYCNSFGLIGSQWDALSDMLVKNPSLMKSVNLKITDEEIIFVLQKANIKGYRFEGAKTWIRKSIDSLRELALNLESQKGTKDEYNEEQVTAKTSLDDKILSANVRLSEQKCEKNRISQERER